MHRNERRQAQQLKRNPPDPLTEEQRALAAMFSGPLEGEKPGEAPDTLERFSEAWFEAADMAHHRAKVSGSLERDRLERGLDLQLRHTDARGVVS